MGELEALIGTPEERGLDLLVRPISWIEFGGHILRRTEPLKTLLTDPSVFVGIGPIYSDEILFDAGIRYDRPASGLSMQELRRLYRSVVGILHDAIKYRGTSLAERPFLDLSGKPGEYADHLAVYGKAGELSPRSRLPIEKAQFRGMTVYYCSTQV
jgi:formamidopyrimidine-DNA glycosylase